MDSLRPSALLLSAILGAAAPHAQSAHLLVLNKQDSTLSIVDPQSGTTAASVPTGSGPHEIEASADGRLAFVSNYGAGDSLSVIDLAARKELRRVDLGSRRRPHGLAISGNHLYFSAEGDRSVGRYDIAADKVDWKLDTGQEGTHMVVASRDGAKLFTSNMGSNTISVIERGANDAWAQTLVKVGDGPEGLDLSPDGRELWTAHSRDGGVSVIDVASRTVVHTLDAKTKRSNRLKFARNGELVLISDLAGGELIVLDAKARRELARLPVGRAPAGILLTPDNSRAFVALAGDDHVASIDLANLTVTGKIATGKAPDGMAWAK